MKKNLMLCFSALITILSPSFVYAQYKSYPIGYYSYTQFSTSGESNIDLFDPFGDKIGILIFLPVSPNLLPAASQDNNGLVRLYYPDTQLNSIVDMLRHEFPISLNYWTGAGNNSHVGTSSFEPAGENE